MSPQFHLFGRLYEALRTSERVLLVAHKKPDGDTIGASSSVMNWLLREKKEVTMFCADTPSPTHRYIDNVHRYTNDPAVFNQAYDVVVIFDAGDLRYCGVDEFVPRLPEGHLLVNVDHHPTNTRYGHMNIVLTDASSTCEIIHRFFEENAVWIDHQMATSLLTGLLFDTNHFSNAGTNPLSIDAASKLVAAGARWNDIQKHVLHDKTVGALRVWGLMLSHLRHNAEYDMVATYLLERDMDNVSADLIDGMSNFLNAVAGESDAILVLRELPGGQVKGSFRSVTRDISKVAKLLGGGGHKKAAGFTIKGRIEEAADGPKIVS